MRILFITEFFGETAPGFVAERIVRGLSEVAIVDVVTSNLATNVNNVNFTNIRRLSSTTLEKWSNIVLHLNLLSEHWIKKVFTVIDQGIDYDLIFCIVSMGHTAPLKISNKLKSHFSCPLFAYFVDAIPAPYPYLKDERLRKVFAKYVNQYSDNVDIIYSACNEMSVFQKNVIENTDVEFKTLLNPTMSTELKIIGKPKSKTFIYTGGIYPPRSADYLLNAFAKLVKYDPEVRLCFIGANLSLKTRCFNKDITSKITSLEFQQDLSPFYDKCCAFIDIACDVENDVFLSSKFAVYLLYNRPIVSESSAGASPRSLFSGMQSVYLCGHNSDELYYAMKDILLRNNEFDYKDRSKVLNKFSIHNAVNLIISDWMRLKNKKD